MCTISYSNEQLLYQVSIIRHDFEWFYPASIFDQLFILNFDGVQLLIMHIFQCHHMIHRQWWTVCILVVQRVCTWIVQCRQMLVSTNVELATIHNRHLLVINNMHPIVHRHHHYLSTIVNYNYHTVSSRLQLSSDIVSLLIFTPLMP